MRIDVTRIRRHWRTVSLTLFAAMILLPTGGPSARGQESRPRQSIDYQVVTLTADGREIDRRQATSRIVVEQLGGGVTLEMVEVPGGAFLMGAGDDEVRTAVATYEQLGRTPSRSWRRLAVETPRHPVAVGAFFMGRFEVTQAEWRAVASMPRVARDLDPEPSEFQGDARPVENVSWYDAMEFCARLSRFTGRIYALPSEAEWEYACRAGTTTPFHFGLTISPDFANYWADSAFGLGRAGMTREETTDVGVLGVANAFGLADMHGNVAEWCLDPWHENYQGAPHDGYVWDGGAAPHHRVTRGGSWYDHAVNCRSAARTKQDASMTDDDTGFRVVLRGQW